jgi:hypothetical protein
MTGIGTDDPWSDDDRWSDDLWPHNSRRTSGRIILIRFLTSIPAVLLGLLSGMLTRWYWKIRTDPSLGYHQLRDVLPLNAGIALVFALGSIVVLLPAVLTRAWPWWVLFPGLFLAAAAGYDLVLPVPHP